MCHFNKKKYVAALLLTVEFLCMNSFHLRCNSMLCHSSGPGKRNDDLVSFDRTHLFFPKSCFPSNKPRPMSSPWLPLHRDVHACKMQNTQSFERKLELVLHIEHIDMINVNDVVKNIDEVIGLIILKVGTIAPVYEIFVQPEPIDRDCLGHLLVCVGKGTFCEHRYDVFFFPEGPIIELIDENLFNQRAFPTS